MQTKNRLAKRRELYVYEQYNVRCFTANPLSVIRNAATRFVNAFIKALNDYPFLPHLVLIIPQTDLFILIKSEGYEFRVMMEHIIDWIITVIDRLIQSKKDMLFTRKPGTVVHKEPKVIWVKAIFRKISKAPALQDSTLS